MTALVPIVFCLVYLGMILGRWPGLALDRTGIAILGAIALVAFGALTPAQAMAAVDVPTMALLFGLMVVSAQFRLGGFYTLVARRMAGARLSPPALLALTMGAAALLSALLANDIVCLAMTPILARGCLDRRLNPMPFLLGLACASNIGSAATLIGNPQNMLIGQVTGLGFGVYLIDALPPSILGLAAAWGILAIQSRRGWITDSATPKIEAQKVEAPDFNAWQSAKGLAAICALVAVFLWAPIPRETAALAAAGLLLLSRRLASRRILALVDWQLLLLFGGLFVVNHALAASGRLDSLMSGLSGTGIDPSHGGVLFALTVALSNLVSNVPAVMLLLPAAHAPQAALVLALASTLAGNLLLVGSIANLIVADQAARLGLRLTWGAHVRAGLPVTLASCCIAGAWLWLRWGSLAVAAP